ncbi:MAG: O-antigen ligase family protein [Pseudomonadota bacterium]|nr:O-antigen ligase family protein [Pseudomonadota bacterium]
MTPSGIDRSASAYRSGLSRPLEKNLRDIWIAIGACLFCVLIVFPIGGGPLAIVGVCVFLILVLKAPLLSALVFVGFSYFRLHEAFPVLYDLRLANFFALATLASAAWYVSTRQIRPFWCKELSLLVLFFVLASLGGIWAVNRPVAFDFWKDMLMKIVLMAIVISWVVRDPKHFVKVQRALVLFGLLVACVAIYNRINGIDLVEGVRVTIGREELRSQLGDPNDLALVLLFPFSFALSFVLTRKISGLDFLFGVVAGALMVVGILFTQSRGGFLGMIAVAGFFIYSRTRSKMILIAIAAFGLMVLFAMAGISDRVSSDVVNAGAIDESALGRIHAWHLATLMMLDHPLTGVGINNFYYNYFSYATQQGYWDGKNHAVHSTWFGVLAETGIPGFVVFCTMVGLTCLSAIKSARIILVSRKEEDERIKLGIEITPGTRAATEGIVAGLFGVLVSGTFLTQAFSWPIYILLAVTIALARYTNRVKTEIEVRRFRLHGSGGIGR